jgi:hypothetical protein
MSVVLLSQNQSSNCTKITFYERLSNLIPKYFNTSSFFITEPSFLKMITTSILENRLPSPKYQHIQMNKSPFPIFDGKQLFLKNIQIEFQLELIHFDRGYFFKLVDGVEIPFPKKKIILIHLLCPFDEIDSFSYEMARFENETSISTKFILNIDKSNATFHKKPIPLRKLFRNWNDDGNLYDFDANKKMNQLKMSLWMTDENHEPIYHSTEKVDVKIETNWNFN